MSFGITDNGEFVDGIYNTKAASYVYSMLIGRKTQPIQNKKNDFTEADIIYKGYLSKEGSWVKSWKTRYFVLRSDIRELCYYSSKEDMTLIGSIKIDENTCVWTNKTEEDQNFVLSWTPPKNSQLDKREVRLRASDAMSKSIWMEHITAEASRTQDIVLQDWWIDLFGNVRYQRKGDEIEARKKANSVLKGLKKFSLVPSATTASSVVAGPGLVGLQGITEEVEGMEESGRGSSMPVSDDMDARAEQLAMKVLTKMRDRRSKANGGGITSMSGLFAGMDDTADELDSISDDSYTGESLLADDINDVQMAKEHKKTIVEKINVDDEEDVDEDFVFSRHQTVVDPNKPRTREQTRSKDSDDDTDDDEEGAEAEKKRVTSRDEKRMSSRPTASKQKSITKVKKEKKIGPPPLAETHADRFDIDGQSLQGLCISVELSHMLEGNEKISCSLSSANLSESAEWNVISYTENYKLEEDKLSSNNAANAHRVCHQFQLLQDPAFLKESTHILVIVYKSTTKKAKGHKKGDNNTPLCSGIVRCDELLATGGITQVSMTVSATGGEVSKPSISKEESSYNIATMSLGGEEGDSTSVTPTANLGVILLSSALMYQRRMKLTSDMKCRPYAENMYCFRTVSGENLVLEQLYASRYSLTVAKAMLELIIPERKAILSETKKTVKNDLKKAISALKNIPSKAALQELDDMLTGGGELDGKNTIETVSRAEALQRTKHILKEINDVMIENYHDCDDHCTQALEGETFPGMVISPDVGGSQLRRSVWKKSPVWQFCTTNLNVHVMTWRKFSDGDVKSNAHLDLNVVPRARTSTASVISSRVVPEAKMSTAASVTFGAPAAHSFGFNEGGIRRMMAGLGSHEETRIKWMCLLQASGGVSISLLKKSSGDYAKEFRKLFDVHVDMATGDGWTIVFQKASKLAMRIDACVSQALGFALASIKTVLTLATYGEAHQTNALVNAIAVKNFLLPVESFLSTQGHEMGMIEDLEAAVLWLSSVRVRLVSSYNHHQAREKKGSLVGLCDDICIRRDEVTGRLVVDLEMNRDEIEMLKRIVAQVAAATSSPPAGNSAKSTKKCENDGIEVLTEFGLTGVSFTCGVNEMQSLVNLSGGKEAYKQNEINYESFERLGKYLSAMNISMSAKHPAHSASSSSSAHEKDESHARSLLHNERLRLFYTELKTTLDAAQASPHVKTPGVLIRSARICREICGTVGILCKSGKDRTSMGVTLEQSCILAEREDAILDGEDATRIMRKYGVRRMNVYANTGQGFYAFNGFQQNLLPKCYRPPHGTYGGNVAS